MEAEQQIEVDVSGLVRQSERQHVRDGQAAKPLAKQRQEASAVLHPLQNEPKKPALLILQLAQLSILDTLSFSIFYYL